MFQALDQPGVAPNWVAGTSIGAINGAINAGNPPERGLQRLKRFWNDRGPETQAHRNRPPIPSAASVLAMEAPASHCTPLSARIASMVSGTTIAWLSTM